MTYNPDRHHRRSIRLPEYDYSQDGTYFITIVCKDRALLLEDIGLRSIVEETWLWLEKQYIYVELDEYVIMPNHLHGLVVISGVRGRDGSRTAPTGTPSRKPLGRLIGAFKTVSTKRINSIRDTLGLPVWQRNYYERIVRDEEELNRVRQYIADNPSNWEHDPENPATQGRGGSRTALAKA